MFLQLTVAFVERIHLIKEREGTLTAHTHQLFSGLLSPTYHVSSKHLAETREEVHEDTAF